MSYSFLKRSFHHQRRECAGKRRYRILGAQQLTEAARLALGETAWQVRSRVRAALAEQLLVDQELNLLLQTE